MKNYFKTTFSILKAAIFDDIANRYMLFAAILIAATDYYIWHRYLSSNELYVYVRIGIYPIKLMAIVLVLNSVLGIFSYAKEKEISYLLMIGNLLAVFLILSLEIFYLTS